MLLHLIGGDVDFFVGVGRERREAAAAKLWGLGGFCESLIDLCEQILGRRGGGVGGVGVDDLLELGLGQVGLLYGHRRAPRRSGLRGV